MQPGPFMMAGGDPLGAGRQIMTPMGMGMPVTPFMPLIKKPDFPPDMQMVFVIPQIANIGKQTERPKCRKLDTVIGVGRYSEWILDRFEDGWEAEARVKEMPGLEFMCMVKHDKFAKNADILNQNLSQWNPFKEENMTLDPFKTLFVGRLSYQTNEKKLKKEFETYGPIKNLYIVKDTKTGQSRGYGFIEFEHKSDFLQAYKYGEGKKIDGHKLAIDYERGRSQLKWRPRRLGGGLGETRRCKSVEVKKDTKDDDDRKRRSRSRSPRSQGRQQRPPRRDNQYDQDDYRLRIRRGGGSPRGRGGFRDRPDFRARGEDHDGHREQRPFHGNRDFRENQFQRGGEMRGEYQNPHHQHQPHQQHYQPHPHPHQQYPQQQYPPQHQQQPNPFQPQPHVQHSFPPQREQREQRERMERERTHAEKERGDREKGEREKGEREKGERERGERERGERERGERERGERERGERERGEREKERSRSRSGEKKHRKKKEGVLELKDARKKDKKKHKKHRGNDDGDELGSPQKAGYDPHEQGQIEEVQLKSKKKKKRSKEDKEKKKRKKE